MYYAVGFGSWNSYASSEKRIPDPNDSTKTIPAMSMFIDGSSAKVAGPFATADQAWKAANKLQEGASMMCSYPFVFKSGEKISLKTIARKIDSDEYEVLEEYAGKDAVHLIRWRREYKHDILDHFRHDCPSSRPARRRYINMVKKARQNGATVPANPFSTKKLFRVRKQEAALKRAKRQYGSLLLIKN